ncbi:LPS translocon maturation chaperone LptM [Providencia rustigianii]|uniref:LPS translocon maturation chaperone LptM n=1 Tax=Providencia rustigianii TaxID=158850 RepID=UPI0038B2F055
MKKSLFGLSALIVLFTLTGCGLKGPLYFPPEESVETPVKSAPQAKAPSSSTQEPAAATNKQ